MTYTRFALMILTSTVVMFGLMYLNTYAFEHVFWSQTRAWMALVMGATMAVVMLGYMAAMYSSRAVNLSIFAGSVVVFAAALWLVRSQATVDGPSYMRAMIPHHSIAIMTSERADIDDARVRALADDIIVAQNREIAEMRYLIAEVAAGNVEPIGGGDEELEPGTVADALSRVKPETLDPAPLPAGAVPEGACVFRRVESEAPILAAGDGEAVMALNGYLLTLPASGDLAWASEGASMVVRPLGDAATWRSDAEAVFRLEAGLEIGYRGFWSC